MTWLWLIVRVIIALEIIFGIHIWRTLGATMKRDRRRRAREAEQAAALANERDHESKVAASAANGAPRTRRLSVYEDFAPRCAVNPFVNISGDMTTIERLHLSVGAAFLLPPRVVVMLLSLVWCWAWGCIAAIGTPNYERPFPWWRRLLMRPMFLTARTILWTFGFWRIRTIGKPATAQEAPLVICNHLGPLEAIALIWQCLPSVVVADENMRAPLLGRIIRTLQAITVDRTDATSRKKSSAQIELRCKTERGMWERISIFPEGTNTNGQALITFRPGSFVPGQPVQPAVAHFHPSWCKWAKHHPEQRRHNHTDPAWVGYGPGLAELMFRMFARFSNPLTIEYLPVYTPSKEEIADPLLFATNVRRVMAKRLGVLATNHTFDDVILQKFAAKVGLPTDSIVVEFGNFDHMFKLTIASARNAVDQFAALDSNKDGRVNRSEFVAAFTAKHTAINADHIFKLFDHDGDDIIDFHDYLVGFGSIHDKTESHQWALRATFRILDTNDDGKVTLDELRAFIAASPSTSSNVDTIIAQFTGDITKEAWKAAYLADDTLSAPFKALFPNPLVEVKRDQL